MAPDDLPGLSAPLAVLLAGGGGARLHELSALEAKPALPIAGRRLADFACAEASAARLPRLAALLPRRPDTLARHLREAWGERFALSLREGPWPDTLTALARGLASEAGEVLLVLPADQIHALDLGALIAAHRAAGRPATLATPTGSAGAPGPCVLDRALLGGAGSGDLWADLLPALARQGALGLWRPPETAYWRDVDTLDDLLAAAIDLRRGTPCPLPPATVAGPLEEAEGRDLALEVGGLRLTAPRFGARLRGRWTVLEDCLVLPGGRVAPGARLSRAVVAPGAVVPANLTVGEAPEEDARWFRVTPGGTTLLTAPMLAARAADRMRAQLGDRLPGLVTPKAR